MDTITREQTEGIAWEMTKHLMDARTHINAMDLISRTNPDLPMGAEFWWSVRDMANRLNAMVNVDGKREVEDGR